MHKRSNSAQRKLELKPERDVQGDKAQCQQHREPALFGQFIANLRAHELHAPQFYITDKRLL